MQTSLWTAAWFLPFVTPIAIWVAWSDMKFMKIPNKAVLALAAVFLIIGPIALPLEVYSWRLLHLAIILAVGFVVSSAGLVGAGDAKFAAAMAPYFALADLRLVLALLAACILGAVASHRAMRSFAPFRNRTRDWKSWTHPAFPMGLALAGTLLFYLGAAILLPL